MNDLIKNVLLWVVIAVILMTVFNNLGGQQQSANSLSYSEFINEVKSGGVNYVHIDGREIEGQSSNGNYFTTYSPETDNRALVGDLLEAGVEIHAEPPEK